MSIDNIKEALPEYAKDLKLNLGTIARTTELNEQQLWGRVGRDAAATKSQRLLREIAEDALDVLSEEAYNAALGAAAIMGMNNVFYRTKGQLDGRYDDLRAGLRMNIIANPGVERADFELWSLAVPAINGCGHRHLSAHESGPAQTPGWTAPRSSRRSGWHPSWPVWHRHRRRWTRSPRCSAPALRASRGRRLPLLRAERREFAVCSVAGHVPGSRHPVDQPVLQEHNPVRADLRRLQQREVRRHRSPRRTPSCPPQHDQVHPQIDPVKELLAQQCLYQVQAALPP